MFAFQKSSSRLIISRLDSCNARKSAVALLTNNNFGISNNNNDNGASRRSSRSISNLRIAVARAEPTNNARRAVPKVVSFSTVSEDRVAKFAKDLPISIKEMDNTTLITLGALGQVGALEEILKRHIMATDESSYEEASAVFKEIEQSNKKHNWIFEKPYQLGMSIGVVGACASVPLVFDLDTVQWFNENYVTADIPEPKDLETWLEVGSWSWQWMEPVLGHVSFFLLSLQFARNQLLNLGLKPYTVWVKDFRAKRVAGEFSKYHPQIIRYYSLATDF